MKKRIIVLSIIFTFLCLNFIAFNSYCAAENGQSQAQNENFFKKYGTDVSIRYDITGRPIHISKIKTAASDKKPEDIALSFLQENESFLSINSSNLVLDKCKEVKFKIRKEKIERTRVILKQMYKGLPVEGKNIKVDVTKKGEIVRIKSRYIPHSDLNIVPKITAENAAAIVMSDLGIKKLVTVKRTIEDRECKKETVPVVPELIVLLQEGEAHLAWKFYFTQEKTMNLWFYGIDAHTGDVISKRDNMVSLSVSGNVDGDVYETDRFDSTESRDLYGARVLVYGWNIYTSEWVLDDTDWTDSDGDYTCYYGAPYNTWYFAVAETYGRDCAVFSDYTGNPAYVMTGTYWLSLPNINFDLDYTPVQLPYLSNFDQVNVYEHVSISLEDYYDDIHGYDLGYDIAVLTHNDYGGPGSDNAYYSPLDHMLFFGAGGAKFYNLAHARDVILHELQHAVTDEIYAELPYDPNTFIWAINESFSDYFACSQTDDEEIGEGIVKDPNKIRNWDDHFDEDDWTWHDGDPSWGSREENYINSQVISHQLGWIFDYLGQNDADDVVWCILNQEPGDWSAYNTACSYCSSADPNILAMIEAHVPDFVP